MDKEKLTSRLSEYFQNKRIALVLNCTERGIIEIRSASYMLRKEKISEKVSPAKLQQWSNFTRISPLKNSFE
jgi:hypothetical protein